jgi:hypothetical protein
MTESTWARPGTKCVCIDDSPDNGVPLSVKRGRRYTISAVRTNTWIGGDHTTVLIAEAKEPNEFWLSRFAPVEGA